MIISPAKAIEAASVLGVELMVLNTDELSRAYRDRAKECHPDHHGNAKLQEWARVSWARECLGHWLKHRSTPASESLIEQAATCLSCGGSGRVKVVGRRFGAPLTVMCDMCRGSGTLEIVEDDSD